MGGWFRKWQFLLHYVLKMSSFIYHSELKCPISFVNWFWDLIVANRSIIFTKKGQFLLKKFIRGHKGQKGQWRPKKASKVYNFKSLKFYGSQQDINPWLYYCHFWIVHTSEIISLHCGMAAKILIVPEEWAKHDANPRVRFVLIHSLFANLVI